MDMKRGRKKSSMLGLVMAFALAGGGLSFALNEQSGTTGGQAGSSQDLLLNANTLIGNTVQDKAGKELGTVKDLLIDQSTGQISYIILAYGGMLGVGEENYSIPWQDVTLTKKDDELVMQVAEVPIQETQTKGTDSSARNQAPAGEQRETEFNPATVETVEGTVENVDNEILEAGLTDSLVVLDIQTASGKERVRIAPDDYLKEQGIEIKEGDQVEITGSRTTRDGEKMLVASKITLKKSGKAVTVRQQDGTPQWDQEKGISTKSKTRAE
jgi:sporulation protein YlmC with PRC-barrel domain